MRTPITEPASSVVDLGDSAFFGCRTCGAVLAPAVMPDACVMAGKGIDHG